MFTLPDDHCPVPFSLNINIMVMQNTKTKLAEVPEKFLWDTKATKQFESTLQSNWFQEKLSQLSESPDEYSVDESTEKITHFLKLAAEKCSVKKFKSSSRYSKKEEDDMPWFDSECDINKRALTDLAKELKIKHSFIKKSIKHSKEEGGGGRGGCHPPRL